jgi:5'(3')-deoxyribonucleotidase
MKCLVDMDGVLVDFVNPVCKTHNVPNPFNNPKNWGNFNVETMLDMSVEDFWRPLDYDWWMSLPLFPEAEIILSICCTFFGEENVSLLSNPSHSPDCIKAKMNYIQQKLPAFKKRFLLGPAKEFCAGSNNLLVDDSDRNIEKFVGAGGIGFTYPRPWNKDYKKSEDFSTIENVKKNLPSALIVSQMVSQMHCCI